LIGLKPGASTDENITFVAITRRKRIPAAAGRMLFCEFGGKQKAEDRSQKREVRRQPHQRQSDDPRT
jgi:hypothetical protein